MGKKVVRVGEDQLKKVLEKVMQEQNPPQQKQPTDDAAWKKHLESQPINEGSKDFQTTGHTSSSLAVKDLSNQIYGHIQQIYANKFDPHKASWLIKVAYRDNPKGFNFSDLNNNPYIINSRVYKDKQTKTWSGQVTVNFKLIMAYIDAINTRHGKMYDLHLNQTNKQQTNEGLEMKKRKVIKLTEDQLKRVVENTINESRIAEEKTRKTKPIVKK